MRTASIPQVSSRRLTPKLPGLTLSSQNSDVYLGYTGWAAGGFDSTYELTETPTQNGNSWTDTALVKSCIVGAWKDS